MAAVHGGEDAPRIKLFGQTISLVKEEARDGQNRDDSTAEKRPEKIIPCPRCKSLETKFCYFNNYNVNQPRHFCKGCQRYWTAGGALRNVPVGAGRRKNKPVVSGFSQNCFDGGGVHQFELDGVVVEEWRVASHGGLRHVFPVKRPRIGSGIITG